MALSAKPNTGGTRFPAAASQLESASLTPTPLPKGEGTTYMQLNEKCLAQQLGQNRQAAFGLLLAGVTEVEAKGRSGRCSARSYLRRT